MKKTIVTTFAFILLAVSAAFANGKDISKNVLTTFAAHFSSATNVTWEDNNTYFTAGFQINKKTYHALIAKEGDIIAVSRNISSTELPAELQSSLPVNFSVNWITDVVEYTIGEETKYYITIENANERMVMESFGGTEWSSMKKINK